MAHVMHIMRTPLKYTTYTYDDDNGEKIVEQRVLAGKAWCGAFVFGKFFLDAEHAKKSLDGSLRCCKRCWRAAVRSGAVTPPERLEIDTWAMQYG